MKLRMQELFELQFQGKSQGYRKIFSSNPTIFVFGLLKDLHDFYPQFIKLREIPHPDST